MTDWAPLDVAIGIVAVYVLLSLIASTINESIATALGWRAQTLERWLKAVLSDPGKSAEQADAALTAFWGHPLLKPLLSKRRLFNRDGTKLRKPSYIPSDVFATVLLNPNPGVKLAPARTIDTVIGELPSEELQKIATTFRQEVGDDLTQLRSRIERWYDDSMERVSGWYKRRVHLTLALIGLALAIVLNADTVQVSRTRGPRRHSGLDGEGFKSCRPSQDSNFDVGVIEGLGHLSFVVGGELVAHGGSVLITYDVSAIDARDPELPATHDVLLHALQVQTATESADVASARRSACRPARAKRGSRAR